MKTPLIAILRFNAFWIKMKQNHHWLLITYFSNLQAPADSQPHTSTSETFRGDSSLPLSHNQFGLMSLSWIFCQQKETYLHSLEVVIVIDSWHFPLVVQMFHARSFQIYKSICISWMNQATFCLLKWPSQDASLLQEIDHILVF